MIDAIFELLTEFTPDDPLVIAAAIATLVAVVAIIFAFIYATVGGMEALVIN